MRVYILFDRSTTSTAMQTLSKLRQSWVGPLLVQQSDPAIPSNTQSKRLAVLEASAAYEPCLCDLRGRTSSSSDFPICRAL